jgi:type IV secretion system protein VirB3
MAERSIDTLYVAMTRPAMRWGVPLEGLVVNIVFTLLVTCVFIGRPPGFAIGFVIHFIMREWTRHDPHFFRRWRLWYETKFRSQTRGQWGGSRLQPSSSFVRQSSDVRSSIDGQ